MYEPNNLEADDDVCNNADILRLNFLSIHDAVILILAWELPRSGTRYFNHFHCVCMCERERERGREGEREETEWRIVSVACNSCRDVYFWACMCVCICTFEHTRVQGAKLDTELNRSLFVMYYVIPLPLPFFVPQRINNTDRSYCKFRTCSTLHPK